MRCHDLAAAAGDGAGRVVPPAVLAPLARPVVVVKRAHGREVGALGEVVEGRGGRPAREHGRQAAGAAVTAKEERVRVCCCLSCVVKVTRQGVTGAVRRRHV